MESAPFSAAYLYVISYILAPDFLLQYILFLSFVVIWKDNISSILLETAFTFLKNITDYVSLITKVENFSLTFFHLREEFKELSFLCPVRLPGWDNLTWNHRAMVLLHVEYFIYS